MIRNILYSLFLHSIIALLVYTNLSFYRYKEEENKEFKTTVQFLVKVNKPKEVTKKPIKKKIKKVKKKKIVKTQNKKENKSKTKKIINKEQKLKNYPESEDKNATILQNNIKKTETEEVKEDKLVESHELPLLTQSGLESEGELQNLQEEQNFDVTSLSLREKFNIQNQIKRCYKKAINDAGIDGKIPVNVTIIIEKDGTIDLNLLKIHNFEKYNDPREIDFHIAVDNVMNAIIFCSPLRNLPIDKYEIWRELNLQFDDDVQSITNKKPS